MTEHITMIDNPDTLLTRAAAAEALTAAGFPVSRTTLATKASRGGGPRFRKFGARPLYRWGDLLAWAASRLGPVVSSTAELDRADGKASTAPRDPADPKARRAAPRQRTGDRRPREACTR
jgi:hypothetical protein